LSLRVGAHARPHGKTMDEIFDKGISIIEIQNWTYMWQRSIIAPVSTILLQDNSLKPAQSGLFFVLFSGS
jgi:hypothetical protein